jgi:protein-tyrosine kinase
MASADNITKLMDLVNAETGRGARQQTPRRPATPDGNIDRDSFPADLASAIEAWSGGGSPPGPVSPEQHDVDTATTHARKAARVHNGTQAPAELMRTSVRRMGTALRHRFDEMKVNLFTGHARESLRFLMVVGTARGDGVSSIAHQLAASLARDPDARILLVNADLASGSTRRSAAQQMRRHWSDADVPPNLYMLPGGESEIDPVVLFQSRRFDAFMAEAARQFDHVVIDAPPLDEAPGSAVLSGKVDGVILLVDAQRTRRKIALRAKQRIESAGGRIIGCVLNRRRYHLPRWLYDRL